LLRCRIEKSTPSKEQFLYQVKRCHSEWFLNYPARKQAVDVRNFSNL